MLLNCFVGKTRLWHGQPFLVKTWFESTPSDFSRVVEADPGNFPTTATFTPAEFEEPEPGSLELSSMRDFPIHVLAIDTYQLPPGVYEVMIQRGGQRIAVPELLWLLPRHEYADLVSDELSEAVVSEPEISNAEEFNRYLQSVRQSRWPDAPLEFEVHYGATVPFSFGEVEGLVAVLLETFRYLAVFGMTNSAKLTISLGNDTLEFGIKGTVDYVPTSISKVIYDSECSDLQIARNVKAMQREEFDWGLEFSGDQAEIRVQQSMPTAALEYA